MFFHNSIFLSIYLFQPQLVYQHLSLEYINRISCYLLLRIQNRPLSNYASVPMNSNLKSRLPAKIYSKCMKTWHEASTSGYCLRELKCNSKVVY